MYPSPSLSIVAKAASVSATRRRCFRMRAERFLGDAAGEADLGEAAEAAEAGKAAAETGEPMST